jgi:hypothetical protein
MSNLHPDLPAFPIVEAALRAATDRLVGELCAPGDRAPEWNEFEWGIARSVSVMHGISGLLASRLRWRGPDSWQVFLTEQHQYMRQRDEHARKLVAILDRETRHAGIACVPLKGAALLALGLHGSGERPMSDVDVLVAPEQAEAMTTVLRAIDYTPTHSCQRHTVFAPMDRVMPRRFGEHPDVPFRIEVHPGVTENLPVTLVDVTDRIWPDSNHAGNNPYRSTAALMCHLLLHAAGNMRANALRHIQLIDVALLARRMNPAQWAELLGTPSQADRAWWMYPVMGLTSRMIPGAIPADVLAATRAVCPALLRARSDRQTLNSVSWSNLRIAALPGYEWSRTPLELLRFARSRLLPRRQALNEVADTVTQQPDLLCIPWYQQSHLKRILRWVTSRPPRVQTMVTLLGGQTPR